MVKKGRNFATVFGVYKTQAIGLCSISLFFYCIRHYIYLISAYENTGWGSWIRMVAVIVDCLSVPLANVLCIFVINYFGSYIKSFVVDDEKERKNKTVSFGVFNLTMWGLFLLRFAAVISSAIWLSVGMHRAKSTTGHTHYEMYRDILDITGMKTATIINLVLLWIDVLASVVFFLLFNTFYLILTMVYHKDGNSKVGVPQMLQKWVLGSDTYQSMEGSPEERSAESVRIIQELNVTQKDVELPDVHTDINLED